MSILTIFWHFIISILITNENNQHETQVRVRAQFMSFGLSTLLYTAVLYCTCEDIYNGSLDLALNPVILLSVDWRHCLLKRRTLSVLAVTCLALRWQRSLEVLWWILSCTVCTQLCFYPGFHPVVFFKTKDFSPPNPATTSHRFPFLVLCAVHQYYGFAGNSFNEQCSVLFGVQMNCE